MGFNTQTPAVLTYLPETNLFVSSGSGDDNGAGTIADPLQSLEEALKNVHSRRLNGDSTNCSIFLLGNTGDADVLPQIRYYWPNKYFSLMGDLNFYNWDGGAIVEGQNAPATPAVLYTGSAVVYSDSYTTNMDHWGGGLLCTLYTDSDFSTPVNYGEAGSMGPLSEGWFLGDSSQLWYTWGNAVPIAHVITGGVGNTIRVVEAREDTPFSINPWTTANRGDMQVLKWGTVVDFSPAADVQARQQTAAYKQYWYNLELTSSWSGDNRGAYGNWSGRVSFYGCTLKYDTVAGSGGYLNLHNCYFSPNDQSAFTNMGGNCNAAGFVVDMGKTLAGFEGEDFFCIRDNWVTDGYNVFQNVSSSTLGLNFGANAYISNGGTERNCIWHITNSAGFYGGGTTFAARGASVHTGGPPIKLLGQTANPDDGGTYILRMPSGSAWNWHTGSLVMQPDGVTECLVSVSIGESQGSADLFANSYIVNYTSSIARGTADAANYPTYATDYSSSLKALEELAD